MCEEMEMPCPCQHCGEIFDLHDGSASEKWYPNIVICEKCGDLEDKEVETDEEVSETIEYLENSLYTVSEKYVELDELLKKRKEMGVVEEPFIPSIKVEQLIGIGWVIDDSNPSYPVSKDLFDRSKPAEGNELDNYIGSLVCSQKNGYGKFGLIVNGRYVMNLNITRIEELKILEHFIAGVDTSN